jgi:nickel-dependent lactate racemase
LVSLGETGRGHLIRINRDLLDAGLKILTGFIEPHFFAGYSGGPKAILPGLAGADTIFANHSPEMIADPQAGFDRTVGNPIWEEMLEAALRVKSTFLVNVTLDRQNAITGVFAGDLQAAHAKGCDFVRQSSRFRITTPYDVVITTNSGYPLDQNLYQCVKGLAAAGKAVRKGGAILLLAACEEGLPDHGEYARLLREAGSPQAVLDKVLQPGFSCQDSWQVQIQAQVQLAADVYLYSEGLSDQQVQTSLLTPCRDLEKDLADLIRQYGSRVCVLPQGPLTILDLD